MDYLLLLLLSLSLLTLAIQDFTQKKFYWILLPIIFISGFFRGVYAINLIFWVSITFINMVIGLALLLFLFLYYFIIGRSKSIGALIGLGDVLLILSLTSVFLPFQFLFSILISSFLALIVYLLIYNQSPAKQIPYAGWLGVVTLLFTVYNLL